MPTNTNKEEKCSDTHSACEQMLKENGGRAVCCSCSGHECPPQTKPTEKAGWEERFDKEFKNSYIFRISEKKRSELKSFLNQEIASAEKKGAQETIQKIRDMIFNHRAGDGLEQVSENVRNYIINSLK